jgi:hypothetical protein
MTTPTTTKRKPRKQTEAETQTKPMTESAILDPSEARIRCELWERRFNFIASLDPIAYKHFYRTVQRSGMTVAEVVDSQRGSF